MRRALATDDTKPIVLLIDDSVDVHRLLRARLKHEHIQLVATTSGLEGVEFAKGHGPSTILLDLDMPGVDGFETLRALKEEGTTHNIPVIVLSGMDDSEDKVTAFDLGATDYVTKPCDLAELRARLRASLRLDHLLRLLAERADVDGLTGLSNRSHFDKRWAAEVEECKRYGTPLSIALLDIDHFKSVNDTYGHPAGDEVLAEFAQLIAKSCRTSDIPCRYGGEEFAMIMPHTSPEDAKVVCERIRQSLRAMEWPRHPERVITVSIGVAGCAGGCTQTPEQWLEQADQCLYGAKRAGRDRVATKDLGGPAMAKAG